MIQWFKKHPEFLRSESKSLSSDSNYKELHQCRDNLFISYGNIIVRLNEIHRFPVLIIYTDATPYQLPIIFPLQKNFTISEIEEIASLSLHDAISKVKSNIEFYFELRHQNATGELCVLERDNLDSENSFYGITAILQRVRDWFAGHITGVYPPDSEEVDFCAHFNFINEEIKLIYPDSFLNDQIIEGDCYSILYNVIHIGKYTQHLYWGSYIDGIGKNGLFQDQNIDLSPFFQNDNIKKSIDLYEKKDLVNQLINDKKILKSQWFQVTKEPKPFNTFRDLIEIIGNYDYENGVKRITARCLENFRQIPNSFMLAIRFPNRNGMNEFQLFKIYENNELQPYIITTGNQEERMKSILERFEKVEAIECEKLTEITYHQRNSKRADYEILKKATLNIFGTGAIGGEIADCMSKAGTGKIALFDNQLIKAHNAVRHIVGLECIGMPKVNAVAAILRSHNPFIQIWTNPLNLYNLDTTIHLDDDSIAVSSVADDNVEGFVNQQMVITDKTTFYVRALRGGKAARIFRVIPGQDACFHCLALYRNEKKEFIEIPDDPLYPTLKNECNNPIRPASAADLKFIGSLASRILIDHIQDGTSNYNHWIWSSEIFDGTPIQSPYQLYSQTLPPHSNCFYCNIDKASNVSISKDCISNMQNLIKINPKIETGGVMAGRIEENGDIIITNISKPGPNSIQTATKFEKDTKYCQEFLDNLYIQSNNKIIYVGEWHSHPTANNSPSGTDIRSLSEIAIQKNYLTECPVMIIFSNEGAPSCTLIPAGKHYYRTELQITQ